MRRWNGWGDDTLLYPVSGNALSFVHEAVGHSAPPHDASLDEVLATVPASRLPHLPAGLVRVEPLD